MNRGRQRAQWRERIRQQRPAQIHAPNIPSVHLRVNELVLSGFSKSSARRITSDFEHELTALLQSRGLPADWRAAAGIDRARTAPLRLGSLTDVRGVGEQLARRIFALSAGRGKSEGAV